jgi:putative restriction endonuclease
MKAFIAVTDNDWFDFLSRRPDLDEVNFWTPSGKPLANLGLGQPVLFKLHAPHNYIAGGGFFATFSALPTSMAWETFGETNGAPTLLDMRRRIERYRRVPEDLREDYQVGCTILVEPFFFDRPRWIPAPADFSPNIVRGKSYDLRQGLGRDLWEQVLGSRALVRHAAAERAEGPMFGDETLVRPRLGQGAFRVLVTDTYRRRCAVTGERALPVLQAAHIRPVSEGGTHRLDNGLLLRSDVHALYDRGYVTVTPDFTFRASKRLKDDFDNGAHYFALSGSQIWVPSEEASRPARDLLEWHADTVFKG